MTLAAEVRGRNAEARVTTLARLIVRPGAGPDVVAVAPDGDRVARAMLEPELIGPDGRQVTPADGASYLRVLRWARSSDQLWITTLAELPDDAALDPNTPFPSADWPYVPATVPYPAPPETLADVEIVELCQPRPDDLLDVEVVARVVRMPDRNLRIEVLDPGIADVVRGSVNALQSEGGDVLEALVTRRIRPTLAGRRVRFGRPFDRASRNAVVALHRKAVAAGDDEERERILAEYETRLPRIWLSRCPFTDAVVRLAVDAHGFDGPWFDPIRPTRPVADLLPATFLAVTGEVPPGAGSVQVAESWAPGSPWVVPRLLDRPGVGAVLSMTRVGKTGVWLVTYFSEQGPGESSVIAEWGASVARVPTGGGAWRLVAATEEPNVDRDLGPWIQSGKLSWIEPFDMAVGLCQGPNGFPDSYVSEPRSE